MKIYLFAVVFLLISCEKAIKNEIKPVLIASNESVGEPRTNNNTVVNSKEDFIGTWTGEALNEEAGIYTAKFAFLFEDIKGDAVSGRILYGDEIIPFKAKITTNNQKFKISWDNTSKNAMIRNCDIQIVKGQKTIKGTVFLNPYKDPEIPQKPEKHTIGLEKSFFVYGIDNLAGNMFYDEQKKGKGYRIYHLRDAKGNKIEEKQERDGYFATTEKIFKINPSKEILTNETVENLTKADLYILIQLVYAKHGLIFKDKKLSEYFLSHKWYFPMKENVDRDLTEIEKENIDLLKRYELNAKEYYQVFGR